MELKKDVWITVTCAKAPGVFSVRSISGGEELGTLYEYHVELFTNLPTIDMRSLLAEPMTVHLDLGNGEFRHLSGVVSKIRRGETDFEGDTYHVTLRPEQHKLTYRYNCRIFQNVSVFDAVKTIFEEHGLRAVRKLLFGEYRKWDYLTQYRESDFEFIRRILALEGIYFYFDHLADGHQMVLADSISSHDERPGFGSLPLCPTWQPTDSPDYLTWWSESYELATREVSLRDFDFRHRGTAAVLKGKKNSGSAEDDAKAERYEYPGIFALHENENNAGNVETILDAEKSEGERLASVRLEEKQSKVECYEAEGNARCLQVGSLFAVTMDLSLARRQFLVLSTEVTFRNPIVLGLGKTPTGDRSYVRLTAMDSKTQFRMPRLEKPVVFGAQTARVVGGKDDEIMTDKYGRIKVKFHWDRREESEEDQNSDEYTEANSSCWVRVMHPWAGTNWGFIHIPRVGQEVVVQFMDGDPDRPLVTGGVYNAKHMPPYKLTDHMTQSGIKSRSTKGGTENNFNEIRFEDLKGKEELHLQAERVMSTLVKASQSTDVGGDRTVTVHGKQTTEVTKDEKQTYKLNRTMEVTETNKETIHKAHTGIYQLGRTMVVNGDNDILTVEKNKTISVKGKTFIASEDVLGLSHGKEDGDASIFLDTDLITISNKSKSSVVLSEGKIFISAPEELNLLCGDAMIAMAKDGTITISGNSKVVVSGGKTSTVTLDPSAAAVVATMIKLNS
jgi:type VI secretion system secreted protein VgrG